MEYADARRSELLIGYGDGDSSARVLRIPTAEVMRVFKGDLVIRTRNAARISAADDPSTSTKQHTFLMVAASSNIILVLLIGGVLRLLPQKSGIAAATPKARRFDHLSGVRTLASFWIVADHLTRWFYQTFCGAEDPDYSLCSQSSWHRKGSLHSLRLCSNERLPDALAFGRQGYHLLVASASAPLLSTDGSGAPRHVHSNGCNGGH